MRRKIIFPRPEKELLLNIRQGFLDYKEVAEIIDIGMEELVAIKANSTLREKPDFALADEIVYKWYKKSIDGLN